MDKIRKFAEKYFRLVGGISLFIVVTFSIFDLASPSTTLHILRMMMVANVPTAVFSLLLFENGPYELSFRVRWNLYSVLQGLNFAVMLIFFGFENSSTGWEIALHSIYVVLSYVIIFAVAYFILKVIHKRKIQKINEKLNELNKE